VSGESELTIGFAGAPRRPAGISLRFPSGLFSFVAQMPSLRLVDTGLRERGRE